MKNVMRPEIIAIALALVCAQLGRPAHAQLPVDSLSLAVGFGVDVTTSPNREILALWKHYLTEPSDSVRATLWSTKERLASPYFDLLQGYVYQGFRHFTVVHLGAETDLPEPFVIRTLVSDIDSSRNVRPLALYRVYATLEDGRWVLANALPRNTQHWRRTTVGSITFVYPPEHLFDRRLARSSAAYVDSLARVFGLPKPGPISYYFTDDMGETLRALGLDFFPGRDPVGGRSNTVRRHVYVWTAVNGEAYRHELAHVVLAPLMPRSTSRLVVEGLMTWVGGSAGLTYLDLLPALARYLSSHPELTLEALLETPPPRVGSLDVGYDGLAVLCKMVFLRAGADGIRSLLSAGRDPRSIVNAAASTLGVSAVELNMMWRKESGVP